LVAKGFVRAAEVIELHPFPDTRVSLRPGLAGMQIVASLVIGHGEWWQGASLRAQDKRQVLRGGREPNQSFSGTQPIPSTLHLRPEKCCIHWGFAGLLSDDLCSCYDDTAGPCKEKEPEIWWRPKPTHPRNITMQFSHLLSAGSRAFLGITALSVLLLAPTTSTASPLQILPGEPVHGEFTLQQQSNGRYMDAHEGREDNSVVTRDRQDNDTQVWILRPVGTNTYTLQQKSSGLYLDAHEGSNDNSVVTRDRQNNLTQRWTLVASTAGTYTLQQVSSGMYLDAHEGSNDNSVVTRPRQFNQTQNWILSRHVVAPPPPPVVNLNGAFFIQQRSTSLFLDAHEGSNDNSAVTRQFQNNRTQIWQITPLGDNLFTIRQHSSNRFLDAHEVGHDFSAVTREAQANATQRWVFRRVVGDHYVISQQVNGRYLEAHEGSNDNSAMTRPFQGGARQQWTLVPAR